MNNVNVSCIRCNLIRRDMPIQAWEKICPAIRKAREDNLFGTWTGRIHLLIS